MIWIARASVPWERAGVVSVPIQDVFCKYRRHAAKLNIKGKAPQANYKYASTV